MKWFSWMFWRLYRKVTHISPSSCRLNRNEVVATLTRRFPVLLSRWVSDSGIASALWTSNPRHLGCRTLFLSCFCSWWNLQLLLSVHPKMSSVCTKTDRYFVLPGLHHNSCWADRPKMRKSNENPCSGETRLGEKEKRQCWISHSWRAMRSLISATQQTHQDGRLDMISSGGRTAGHWEVYSIVWNTAFRVTLSHWKAKLSDNSC